MEGKQEPEIAVIMIVKNEEAMLGRCLESVKDADYLYISDTGSEDKTVEIAKKYTTRVFDDYKWADSFCAARNHILDKAREELKGKNIYCISIDADEYLHDFSKLREAVDEAHKIGALSIDCKLYSEKDKQLHYYPRLFKLDPKVWWEGVAHNHISEKATMTCDVEITYGYSPAHQLNPNRTLNILKKEVDRTGNARETFYLGREYWYRQQYKECAEIMKTYVQKAHFLAEKADAYLILARCYWAMGIPDEARNASAQALIINPHFKENVLFMAQLAGKGSGNPIWEKNGDWWFKASDLSDNSSVLFIRNT